MSYPEAIPKALPGGAPGAIDLTTLVLNRGFIVWTIVAFTASIAIAAWVLGSLPSVAQRLPHSSLALGAHGMLDLPLLGEVPLYALTFLQHAFFGIGLITLILALPLTIKSHLPATIAGICIVCASALVVTGLVAVLLRWWQRQVKSGRANYKFESIYRSESSRSESTRNNCPPSDTA
jgi:hypothetical protein